jgi:hypothetical protein
MCLSMVIKIIKEKRSTSYIFIEDSLSPGQKEKVPDESAKKDRMESDFRLRGDNDMTVRDLKNKSKLSGGHNMQGHSAIYE